MSEKQLKEFKKQRENIKRQLTTFEKLLDSVTDETNIENLDLEDRFKDLILPLNKEFEKCQEGIETLSEENDETIKANHEERSAFENRYYSIRGRVKTLLRQKSLVQEALSITNVAIENNLTRNEVSSNDSSVGTPENNSVESQSTIAQNNTIAITGNAIPNHRLINRKLPELKIPTFSGSFDTRLGFYDTFNSMIHTDEALPQIQKFHYLKGCLIGDAANIIASLETTSENYSVAWELLKARYHNKKFIVDSHVKSLFEIPCVSKEFSMCALFDMTQKHLRALRALSVDVDKWDAILIHLIKWKLNSYLRDKWEEASCDNEMPLLKDLLDFLERRAKIEETRVATAMNYNSKNIKTKGDSNTRNPFKHARQSQASFSGATMAYPSISILSFSFHCKQHK
ncbi:uncharacterized protein LOC117176472 [Belonocnema kinseyi]|uniref:uncharacterized protein LOC117176472 n=1 Tax=Belonocnema kinseyi TaxID=2817044 RepID=UPI00143D4C94|nr:uncharacterized protein LOC117176472 [Belonocnema kinseyi]